VAHFAYRSTHASTDPAANQLVSHDYKDSSLTVADLAQVDLSRADSRICPPATPR